MKRPADIMLPKYSVMYMYNTSPYAAAHNNQNILRFEITRHKLQRPS